MTTPTLNVHHLLQQPREVSIQSRDALIAAHHERIRGLTNHFQAAHNLLRPALPVTVYYYSDNGGDLDDTAPQEIQRYLHDSANAVSALSGIEKPSIVYGNTPAQNWVAGGFDLAQTTRAGLSGVGNVTFLNCAPRLDERGQKENNSNKGEPIYVGVLPNGHVISANSRYNFAFFRDAVENGALEIFEANVQPDGTQFRSRDIFPTHAVVLANLLTQNIDKWKSDMTLEERRELLAAVGYVDLDSPLALEDIPQLKKFSIAHIDVHGNIKTNTRLSELSETTIARLRAGNLKVSVGEKTLEARFTDRMFDRAEGEAGFSTGSSGAAWQGAAKHDGFLELSIIGGDAVKALDLTAETLRKETTLTIPGIVESNDNPTPDIIEAVARTGGHQTEASLEAYA